MSGEAGDPDVDGGDVGLAGEDLLGQHPVDLGVGVAAAVGQDGETVVEVGGLTKGGQDDAAGGEAGQDEVVDGAATQDEVEIARRRRR